MKDFCFPWVEIIIKISKGAREWKGWKYRKGENGQLLTPMRMIVLEEKKIRFFWDNCVWTGVTHNWRSGKERREKTLLILLGRSYSMLELEFTEGGDHFHSLPCHLISTTLQHRDWYLIYVFDEVNYDLFMLILEK